jgi:hypothetical protein
LTDCCDEKRKACIGLSTSHTRRYYLSLYRKEGTIPLTSPGRDQILGFGRGVQKYFKGGIKRIKYCNFAGECAMEGGMAAETAS